MDLSRRFEPYIRQQAEQYLRTRFHADVHIAALHVQMPRLSPLRILFTRGRGATAWVKGEGITMSIKGRPDTPPLFTIGKFMGGVDLGTLWSMPKIVPLVTLDGLDIKDQRVEQR